MAAVSGAVARAAGSSAQQAAPPASLTAAERHRLANQYLRHLTEDELEELRYQEELRRLQETIDESLPVLSQMAGLYFGAYCVDLIVLALWKPRWL